jgi:hypothetical protein
MSVVEKRSPSRDVEPVANDGEMPAMTSICVALAVALFLYVLGSAIFQQDVVAAAAKHAGSAEISFLGP